MYLSEQGSVWMTFSMFNIRSASFDHYYATMCTCEVEDTVLSLEVFGKAHLKRDNGARFSHWTNKVIAIHSELDNNVYNKPSNTWELVLVVLLGNIREPERSTGTWMQGYYC